MSDMGKVFVTGVACLALGAVVGNYIPFNQKTEAPAAGVDKAQVETIVADYIAANPEKIIASLQGMQAREAEQQQQAMANAVKDNLAALHDDTNSPAIGSSESGITLVEFFDYRCGYCKRMAGTVQKITEAHPDVKVVFKEYPILSEDSQKASQASLAIQYLAPERYLEYHMMLMKHQGKYTQEVLNDYAGQVQVDVEKFQKEMNGERVAKEIQAVAALADKIGVRGTPALVIGEELIPGAIPFNEVDRKIKALKEG